MKKRFTKNQILTIPNAMSLFRLLLIPLFVWLYCTENAHYGAVAVIGVSILTDVFDGMIARKFDMTSDVGKVLDPVADKLTQAAMILILYTRYSQIIILLLLIILREVVLLVLGAMVLRRTDTVNSSQWYGKAATVAVEGTMVALLLFEDIPRTAADIMLTVCCAFVVFALFGYARMYFGILHRRDGDGGDEDVLGGFRTAEDIAVLILIVFIFLALRFRDVVTVQAILSYSPQNLFLAALVMLLAFAAKSVTFVMYLGVLFVADGLMFPTPAALAVNFAGIAVSSTLPYFIGKKLGAERVDRLVEKNKKMALVRKFRTENDFFFVLMTRLIGLPSDFLSFYMGAAGVPYSKFLPASLLGFAPELVIYTIIGTSMDDPSSPKFKIAVAAEALVILCSAGGYYLYRRAKKA